MARPSGAFFLFLGDVMKTRWFIATILLACAWRAECQSTKGAPDQAKLGGPAARRPANCVVGQAWLATDTGVLSYCAVSGSPGTWQTLTTGSSGGGGSIPGLCNVALTATPVFDASTCGVFVLTLGATAVTGSTLVNAQSGQQ